MMMKEVANTKQHKWIVQGTLGIGAAICILMVRLWWTLKTASLVLFSTWTRVLEGF